MGQNHSMTLLQSKLIGQIFLLDTIKYTFYLMMYTTRLLIITINDTSSLTYWLFKIKYYYNQIYFLLKKYYY